ncbi:MAG TPA: P63C domain-containing protein [Gemmataceae bacterium]|nr:P63C domain-containing protein [Gemmataceae bacterium]
MGSNEREDQEKATVQEAGARGGKARAERMTPEERREAARHAVEARWNAHFPKATHSGELRIGDALIPCAVLEDKTRVLTQRGFSVALGRYKNPKKGSIVELPVFVSAANLKPYIDEELERSAIPIKFRMAEGSGGLAGNVALGYRADLLPKVCKVYLRAKHDEKLRPSQYHIAEKCLMLYEGLATVGIIGLVDEATGFQYERPRRDLEEYLKKFLSDSLRRWVRTFPADYFKHLCRLRGVELRTDMKLPLYFGHLTNNLVYRRLAPGLLKRLKERRIERGNQSNKLHSWLSSDVGVPEVLVHLGTVVGLMKVHTDYDAFEKQLDTIAPVYPETPGLFDDPSDWEPK